MKKKLCVVGLGCLGLPLADLFSSFSYAIYGTTRSSEKQMQLSKRGFKVALFDLYQPKSLQNLRAFMFSDAHLLINIAPGRKTLDVPTYVNSMTKLIDKAIANKVKNIIFISTSSVFGQQNGSVDEASPPSPDSQSGMAHAEIEQYLLSNYPSKSTILRLAGLIGKKPNGDMRHPIYSLAKKDMLAGGREPVNLVHQDDVIRVIQAIINQSHGGEIFHACSIEHPTRSEYYTWAAKRCNLPVPTFEDDVKGASPSHTTSGKVVRAEDTLRRLELELNYPSPFDML